MNDLIVIDNVYLAIAGRDVDGNELHRVIKINHTQGAGPEFWSGMAGLFRDFWESYGGVIDGDTRWRTVDPDAFNAGYDEARERAVPGARRPPSRAIVMAPLKAP